MSTDPLLALARLIGSNLQFGRHPQWEPPSVRQIPYKYHTDEHGPVFAFEITEDGHRARCVSADDNVVECVHEQLLPFRVDVSGAQAIELLDEEISDAMCPNMDERSYKYQPPRRSTIGRFLFEQRIWQKVLHE